jgi:putative ABC transport system permease protein
VFQSLNAFSGQGVNLATSDRPERVPATATTPGFLRMMGHRFELGRDFLDEEGMVGREKVVILTHKFWIDRFAGDRRLVGRPMRIDGSPHTVVDILAAGPAERVPGRLYVPLAFEPEQLNHDFHWLLVMGRLRPGVTLAQATADMKNVTARIARAFPASNTGWCASVEPRKNNFLSSDTKTSL